MSEMWKPIPGFLGYEVSDLGRIRSWRRRNGCGSAPSKPRIRRLARRPNGYEQVTLRTVNGPQTMLVHCLVLLAFVGPCPPGQETLHDNDKRHDNRVENLYWGTKLDNEHGKIANGTTNRGGRHGMAKLTEAAVREIRASPGITQRELGERYGVHQTSIGKIRRGETWRFV